jgi:hypothetical protein
MQKDILHAGMSVPAHGLIPTAAAVLLYTDALMRGQSQQVPATMHLNNRHGGQRSLQPRVDSFPRAPEHHIHMPSRLQTSLQRHVSRRPCNVTTVPRGWASYQPAHARTLARSHHALGPAPAHPPVTAHPPTGRTHPPVTAHAAKGTAAKSTLLPRCRGHHWS